ncbi:MAG: ATP-binding cassette domain-containing protein, partial [Bacteroidia bacterium]|nr:ATP-binding cassette domain-containing protein [Bacteroidia bacterium]
MQYGENTLFTEVRLTVKYGEKLLILGENGCGKSTFLRILFNLEKNQKGTLHYYNPVGLNVGPSTMELARAGIAYMPQVPVFPTGLTVGDFWGFVIAVKKTSMKAENEFLNLAVDGFGLQNYGRTKMELLSIGTLKKVIFTSLFLGNPKVLLLDEPFAHWDEKSIEFSQSLLNHISTKDGTIIVTDTIRRPLLY